MTNSFDAGTLANSSTAPLTATDDNTALDLAYAIAAAADERKGGDITILQVGEVSYLADYFVIVTGFSAVQVRAISRTIEEEIEEKWNRRPLRTEGQIDGSWVVQDFGEVIAHIFLPREREFYNLEAFWGHAERISYVPPEVAAKAQG